MEEMNPAFRVGFIRPLLAPGRQAIRLSPRIPERTDRSGSGSEGFFEGGARQKPLGEAGQPRVRRAPSQVG